MKILDSATWRGHTKEFSSFKPLLLSLRGLPIFPRQCELNLPLNYNLTLQVSLLCNSLYSTIIGNLHFYGSYLIWATQCQDLHLIHTMFHFHLHTSKLTPSKELGTFNGWNNYWITMKEQKFMNYLWQHFSYHKRQHSRELWVRPLDLLGSCINQLPWCVTTMATREVNWTIFSLLFKLKSNKLALWITNYKI